MYLVTAATEYEMQPFLALCKLPEMENLLTGIGPLETAVRLCTWLNKFGEEVKGVINFGVGGAYVQPGGENGPGLLDICIAEREVIGDLGVCLQDDLERFTDEKLSVPDSFAVNPSLLAKTREILVEAGVPCYCGTFVTVNCASGTVRRGNMLARQYGGLCENMEGAAVARVCSEFAIPWLELRCISNMVEDRDTTRWQMKKACFRSAEVTAAVMRQLVKESPVSQ